MTDASPTTNGSQAEGRALPHRRLTWSAGTWFGSLFGCTLWMLMLAGVVYEREPASSLVPLATYLAATGLGCLLWSRQDSLRTHTALQAQLAITGLLALLVLVFVDRRFDLATLDGAWGSRQAYAALLIFPLLMVMFWRRERAARRVG